MQEIKTDILIIGAGLTGLTLAYYLKKLKVNVTLVEARERLGGRIYTLHNVDDPPVEMGATWISSQHTLLLELLEELDIKTFEQEMGASAIYEAISTSPFQLVTLPPSDLPSFRVQHGTDQIIKKLESKLDPEQIYTNQNIQSIAVVDSIITAKSMTHEFSAAVVISTLPPMLFINSISVTPDLPEQLIQIANKTHTWMGDSIKISLSYKHKFWQENNLSGTIFSNVGPIPEMYDHSNVEDTHFALKGFLNGAYFGISNEARLDLILNQLEKYYGAQVRDFIHYEELVWNNEVYTTTESTEYILPHQNNGHPVYQETYLSDHLLLAGTETSALSSGYMEGAINSANQVLAKLKSNKWVKNLHNND
jgi:monoamine oxidase